MSADLKTQPKRQRYEQARLSGEEARRNGRKVGDNPYRGSTALVRDLHSEWAQGWIHADMAIKGMR